MFGGASLLAISGGAAATSSTMDISNSSVSNDDGDVSKLGVSLTHEAMWDGFDVPVHAVEYRDVLEIRDADGNVLGTHVLRDGTDTPVLLENFSGDGDADGWGGPGEYFSPGVEDEDDPYAEAGYLSGSVHADIDWTLAADSNVDSANINSPPGGSVADTTDFGLDNETDDSTVTYTVILKKTVQFYTRDDNGSYTTAIDGVTVALMGSDDGTFSETKTNGTFYLDVTNEDATTHSTGSGSSNAS